MIALLAAIGMVVENFEPAANEISIQALVKIPHLDPEDAGAIEILADLIGQKVEGYSRRDVLTVTNGVPIRCISEPDHLRLVISVLPGNEKSGITLLDAALRHSQFSREDVLQSIRQREKGYEGEGAMDSYWGAALRPRRFEPGKLRVNDIEFIYRKLLRPEAITLTVGGTLVPNLAASEWENKTRDWATVRPDLPARYETKPRFRDRSPSEITTISLEGPEFGSSDAALPTRILALIALGTGKGSSLFRIVREKLNYSYRQEAVLVPTEKGFQPRLIMAMRPSADEATRAETLRAELLKDIASFKEADRLRAIGMAEAVFLRQPDLSPLSLWRGGPVANNLEGRTFLRAYWPQKTSRPWDPAAMCEIIKLVTLGDLKETATDLLTNAKSRILSGRP